MPDDRELVKEAVKEAIREWLDEKYSQFGRWSFHGLAAAGLAAVVYLILIAQGWNRG